MTATTMEGVAPGGVPWWVILIEGIILLLVGVLMLASPDMSSLVLVQFLGFYWLIAGIFNLISIFWDKTEWGWKLIAGILGIIAGLIVVRHPLWAPFAVGASLVIIMGVFGLIMGGIGLYQAFKGAGWEPGILGAVSLLFGLMLLGNVMIYTFALPLAIGILALIGGGLSVVNAFRMRA